MSQNPAADRLRAVLARQETLVELPEPDPEGYVAHSQVKALDEALATAERNERKRVLEAITVDPNKVAFRAFDLLDELSEADHD